MPEATGERRGGESHREQTRRAETCAHRRLPYRNRLRVKAAYLPPSAEPPTGDDYPITSESGRAAFTIVAPPETRAARAASSRPAM